MDPLKYPIGEFAEPDGYPEEKITEWIREMENFPAQLRACVTSLESTLLDTPYRDGGWTVRQVVHHLADSHVNCYVRIKLALTEDCPVIKPYNEAVWAELPEARSGPVELSLDLLDAVHRRLVVVLKGMRPGDWDRAYHHPESGKNWKLGNVLALYAWHGRHHLAHITSLAARLQAASAS